MAPDRPASSAPEPDAAAPAAAADASSSSSTSEYRSAYNDLRRLIPALALELDHLRAALREHNLWLQRCCCRRPGAAGLLGLGRAAVHGRTQLGVGLDATREEVQRRRDELIEWLGEGEDTLREYSARFAQLGRELDLPPEDILGTWNEASPDNALPDYEQVETNEELMVGGVGEVPPPYVRGQALEKGHRG
ncbi:hypothetical protein G7054_g5379 [Neopestalotiopsis clavispora]|nr:hypothetical protein G7054_g5379 [Neopestalotiopsis clavispora]